MLWTKPLIDLAKRCEQSSVWLLQKPLHFILSSNKKRVFSELSPEINFKVLQVVIVLGAPGFFAVLSRGLWWGVVSRLARWLLR